MYAVVAIGSRIRRSAWGMNLRTFCCAPAVVQAHGPAAVAINATAANQRKWRFMGRPFWWMDEAGSQFILSLRDVRAEPLGTRDQIAGSSQPGSIGREP
jgi:hypothetical protein